MFILNQHTCILSVMWAMTCSHPCFLKTIYFKTKKKVTLSILTTHFTTHTMYITLKEGEHWLRKGRGTLAEGEHLWLVPTARPSWGRVKYALGMDTQN